MKLKTLLLIFILYTPFGGAFSNSGDNPFSVSTFNEEKSLAEKGNADAQFRLGWMYRFGYDALKDYKEAAKWYREAAEQGHTKAKRFLGLLYDNTDSGLTNYKEAVKWFREAAEEGDAASQRFLGMSYANGEGVPRDLSKTKYWIKRAYENPDASSSTKGLAKSNWKEFELWKY